VSPERKPERRLGRGLESLLGAATEYPTSSVRESGVESARQVPIDQIRPNPLQPRTGFPDRDMSDLVESIKRVGVLQPLLVRRSAEGYELIAGERRLRAAREAGLSSVPVVERETSDDEMLTLALVENLQRTDLNPIEKARGFKRLIETFSLTQDEAARRVGKDRSTIANFIRLLDLPEPVQHIVARGGISMGHARALLALPHPSSQHALALRIENEGLSVRETESLVSKLRGAPRRRRPRSKAQGPSPHIRSLEDRMRERLGTKVKIDYHGGSGNITIAFFSDGDLQRILDCLGISDDSA